MGRRRNMAAIVATRQHREGQRGLKFTSVGRFERLIDVGPVFSIACHFDSGTMASSAQLISVHQGTLRIFALEVLLTKLLRIYTPDGAMIAVGPVLEGDNFVCVMVTQSHTSVYLNGASNVYPAVNTMVPDRLIIASNTPSWQFFGTYKSVRIFSYALSAAEASELYNDGRPGEWVLPRKLKDQAPVLVVGKNSYTWDDAESPYHNELILSRKLCAMASYKINVTVSNYQSGAPFLYLGEISTIPSANGTYDVITKCNADRNKLPIYGGPSNTDRRLTLTVNSIEALYCIAEYVPQNIFSTKAYDFPTVVFPVAIYTQSQNVFGLNNTTLTMLYSNLPQSNGFGGDFMRFEAINLISTYCRYWITYINKRVPLRITFEYRSNTTIYASQISTTPTAADVRRVAESNEDMPIVATVEYGYGVAAFLFSDRNESAWLEMRILSIDVIEGVAQTWLDSATQQPLNDEYLPPMLQSAGGFDMVPSGTPEIIIKP